MTADLPQGCSEGRLGFCVEVLVGKLMLCGYTLSGEYVFPPLGERILEASDGLLSPCSRPSRP